METSHKPLSNSIEVSPASPDQAPILANLIELYAHDFSEFINLELDENGRFGYEQLPLYWTEPDRFPFLVKVNGNWAGFVFVSKGSRISGDENIWDVTEFFIVRGHRRSGIGSEVAQEIWKMFSGKWEVRVTDQNQPAKKFWAHAISEFAGKTIDSIPLDKDGNIWHVFSFESKPVDWMSAEVC